MICRLCFSDTKFYLLLRIIKEEENEEKPPDIAAIIRTHFDLPLDVNADIICHICWQQINEFHKFYLFVEEKQKGWVTPISESSAALQRKSLNEVGMDIKQEPYENETNGNNFSALNTSVAELEFKDAIFEEPTPMDASKSSANLNVILNDDADLLRSVLSSPSNRATPIESVRGDDMVIKDASIDEIDIKFEYLIDINVPAVTENRLNQWNLLRSPQKTLETSSVETTSKLLSNILANRMLRIKKRYLDQRVKRIQSYLIIVKHAGTFKCDICGEKVGNFDDLKQHFRDEHKRLGYVSCCNVRYFHPNSYAEHLAWHLNPKMWKCKSCTRAFASRFAFESHLAKVHPVADNRKFKCKLCRAKFLSKIARNYHIRDYHSGRNLKCLQCSEEFDSLRHLKDHHSEIHLRIFKTTCRACGQNFKDIQSCRMHELNDHLQCSECPRIFTYKTQLKSHQIDFHSKQDLSCDECNKRYKSANSLARHKTYAHSKSYRTDCDICGMSFKTTTTCRVHKANIHGVAESCDDNNTTFPCDECNREYKSLKSLKNHKHRCHNINSELTCDISGEHSRVKTHVKLHKANAHNVAESSNFECPSCPMKFILKHLLDSHISESHTTKSYTCKECNHECKSKADLKNHKKVVHNEEVNIKCDICGKHLFNIHQWQKHKETKHYVADSWDYQCPSCPEKFRLKFSLKTHISDCHSGTKLSCDECKKEFDTYRALTYHKKRVHLRAYEVECDICGERFGDRTACKMHKASAHKVAESWDFSCPKCPEKFTFMSLLNKHKRIHDDKKFSCDECNKEFKFLKALTDHKKRIHLRAYTTECDICGKQSTDRNSLKVHKARVHKVAESWDFPCTLCPKKFSLNYLLKAHIRNCHPDKPLNCVECNKKFKNLRAFDNHQKRVHLKAYQADCELCGKNFLTSTELKFHKATIHKVAESWNFQCPKCPEKFPYISLLNSHTRFCKNNKKGK